MAEEYKVGERYYLPVTVKDSLGTSYNYPITLEFVDCEGRDTTDTARIADEPELLLTATEIAENVLGRRCAECVPICDELKARNAELEALLKEVTATRDEAIKQNNELLAENKNLKADCNEWKKTANERLSAMQMLSTDRNKLIGSNAELKEWYDEANRTASEAAEANDELKAKIADLRNRVGEQLAQIQDLNAEVHFHKEFGEGLDKQQKELQARYDELDSVNKEQAEKIRKLDKALTDLKQQNDKLQADNTGLTYLLEAQPEKEVTKTLHVTLNDGTEIRFKRCTSYDYRTDIDMLVVKDGDNYIAGFMRGDKPTNIAYWMGE